MKKEFKLSEKVWKGHKDKVIALRDVKEFIRKLKEALDFQVDNEIKVDDSRFKTPDEIIDALAGDL